MKTSNLLRSRVANRIVTFRFTWITIFCILLFSQCKKADDNPITLIHPINTIEKCCEIAFEWEAISPISRFEVWRGISSPNVDVVIDTLVIGSSFVLTKKLHPDEGYFWRIRNNGSIAETSFRTYNYLDAFEGTHNAIVTKSCWPDSIVAPCDETWETTITFNFYSGLYDSRYVIVKWMDNDLGCHYLGTQDGTTLFTYQSNWYGPDFIDNQMGNFDLGNGTFRYLWRHGFEGTNDEGIMYLIEGEI